MARLRLVIPLALGITFLLLFSAFIAALSHAIGSETQRPIAVVVVGGTISAAALSLFVLPVTYYLASRAREALKARSAAAAALPTEPDALPA